MKTQIHDPDWWNRRRTFLDWASQYTSLSKGREEQRVEVPLVSAHPIGPTPYEEVNTILLVLLTNIQAILGPQLVGLYLYGSLSLGDFDPASSDIDFLAVTVEELSEEALEQLPAMHASIASSGLPYATRLEGSYIPRHALRRYDPTNAHHPTIGTDWPFQVGLHGSNWILERQIVREHGVVVWGPSPQTLIDPVSLQEVRAVVCEQLKNWWQPRLNDLDWLRPRHYQAFAVLTLCRALYTLQHGTVSSKPQAATWAQEVYPQWRPIIEKALTWRSQHEIDDLTDTMAFLQAGLQRALGLCQIPAGFRQGLVSSLHLTSWLPTLQLHRPTHHETEVSYRDL
jgi:hypothetical protein